MCMRIVLYATLYHKLYVCMLLLYVAHIDILHSSDNDICIVLLEQCGSIPPTEGHIWNNVLPHI